jgi:signal transduction histidine kinase
VSKALSGKRNTTQSTIWPWETRSLIVAEPLVQDGDIVGALVTVSPTDRLRHVVALALAVLAAAALLVIAGGLAIASRVTAWVLRPVADLEQATRAFGSGQLAARVGPTAGPRELRHLAHAFNDMATRVEASVERQHTFVADASHQLRNPLNALMLRIDSLESALRPGHGEEDYEHVRAEANRLRHILDELLELARVDATSAEPVVVDVRDIVAGRVRAWQPVAENREIEIGISCRGQAEAWAHPVALSTSIDAVLDNALKFSPQGSSVSIDVCPDNGGVAVVIQDEGPGLDDDEMARIGDRFWRSYRHQNVAGSGLGLSIVQALLRPYGGRVEVSRRGDGCGLAVAVWLPVQSSAHGEELHGLTSR